MQLKFNSKTFAYMTNNGFTVRGLVIKLLGWNIMKVKITISLYLLIFIVP